MIERPNWRLSREATRVALVISVPFTVIASLLYLPVGSVDVPAWSESLGMGEFIYYFFGFPLTRIADIFRTRGQMQSGDFWWALPLLNFLFFAQWMIWTQAIALVGKGIDWLCWRDENKKARLTEGSL
ncbi:MAG: hypothetical protein ACJ741_17090 [Pyrinomonadaceae bacterium]